MKVRIVMTFTHEDMMRLLFDYNKNNAEIEKIWISMEGVRSPSLSDEASGNPMPKDSQYNRALERIDELQKRIDFVNKCVDELKEVDEDLYRVISCRWLLKPDSNGYHMSLEDIANTVMYMSRTDFFRKKMYIRAKEELLIIMQKHANTFDWD